jgi:tetratricopeptide (TPR) repeat protein
MTRLVLFILALSLFSGAEASEKVMKYIENGRLDEARQEIGKLASAATRDGSVLYCQALLESDGYESAKFLDAAFKAGMTPEWLEDNVRRKVLYYLADRDYENLASSTLGYLQYWENGKYRPMILRLYALAADEIGKKSAADRHIELMTRENGDLLYGDVGRLEKARRLYRAKDYIAAQNICRALTRSDYDEVVAPAVYFLSHYSFEQKRIDDAILYYNILKESYPDAVGLDDLVSGFSGLKISGGGEAEKITGTYYAVQVGVFSVRDNAREMKKRMEKYGQPLDLQEKTISNKKYYVVYVGKFTSSDEAMAFKTRLESQEKEAFQVVAR